MHLLLTRPQADAHPVAHRLEQQGHTVLIEPLLRVVWRAAPLEQAELDLLQGLLFTSANGVRAFARLSSLRTKPVWAVGDATATAARAAGFPRVTSAAGDVVALAALVAEQCRPEAGPFLHPAASDVAGDLSGRLAAAGFAVRREVLYETATATHLSAEALAALEAGTLDAVLVYSPRTARTLATLIRAAGVESACRTLRALCLSPAVATALAGVPWREVVVATRPDQGALLALL